MTIITAIKSRASRLLPSTKEPKVDAIEITVSTAKTSAEELRLLRKEAAFAKFAQAVNAQRANHVS